MNNIITYRLPFPPSTNHIWTKSASGGMFRTKRYNDFIKAVSVIVRAEKIDSLPLSVSTRLTIRVHQPDRRKRDLDNVLKATQDALVKARVLTDDSIIDELIVIRSDISKPGFIDVELEEIR